MAAMLGGGDGALGQMPLEQWFFEMPVCTRWWTTATVVMGLLVQCEIINPFQLFYSYRAVFHKSQASRQEARVCRKGTRKANNMQYWRLISTFIYFGPLSLNLLFHIFFIQRYARMLEESAPTVAHFAWLLFYAASTLLTVAPLFNFNQLFLGTTLSSTLVYIWSRRNPDTRLSFLGLLTFKAPWLPWVLIGFNVVLHGHWPKDELCGIVVGHIWYFFNDIYPSTHNGYRPMDPPRWWIRLFEREVTPEADSDVHAAELNREVAAPVMPDVL